MRQLQVKNLSDDELAVRAQDARALIVNPMLDEVFTDLQEHYVQELLGNPVGSLTASTAHASMKVLADVKALLASTVADYTMRLQKNRGSGKT